IDTSPASGATPLIRRLWRVNGTVLRLRDEPWDCRQSEQFDRPAAPGRGRLKTQKYSVFGRRFNLPESPPARYAAI
ncbi:hypothetical protein, partial [Paraburkholderia caribensis]|uniref:hypothetical protein n=1 Tax=Paraburkholderia caribensis TaxID=75105 RepID=UPI003F493100